MKRYATFFFLLICMITFAQKEEQNKILHEFHRYINAVESREYKKMVDFYHPIVFRNTTKQELISLLKIGMEGNAIFSLKMEKLDRSKIKIADVKQGMNKSKYAFIIYPASMKMTWKAQPLNESQKAIMLNAFKSKGIKAHFATPSTLVMQQQNTLIAISGAETKNTWKYIKYDSDAPLHSNDLPPHIMKSAKDYHENAVGKN